MIRSWLILTAIMGATIAVVAGVVWFWKGPTATNAALIAGATCWIGASGALFCSAWLSPKGKAVEAHLCGTFFRLGLPIATGILLQKLVPWLAEAGIFGLIVVFYLVSLPTETLLSLKFIKKTENRVTRA